MVKTSSLASFKAWKRDISTGSDNSWHLGLTLSERLDTTGQIEKHKKKQKPKSSRDSKTRVRWRDERRADIGRVRNLNLTATDAPQWWKMFVRAYDAAAAENNAARPGNGFLAALEPIIAQARSAVWSRLRRRSKSLLPQKRADQQQLLCMFEKSLQERLSFAVTKTLVLELAAASRSHLLMGATPDQRYRFFCECLKDAEFSASLLARYPVLVRRCVEIADGWQRGILNLLTRMADSKSELLSTFFAGRDPGPLISSKSAGDTHRGGQEVQILTFQSGLQLVYKPRPVAMERYYQVLVAWLNGHGLHPGLKVVATLDEDEFGWMQFVPAAPCSSRAEVRCFFERMGAHLAIVHVLGGTDLHSENVIANGEHPVAVDLETLFQPDLLPNNFTGATARGWKELMQSVMRPMLLPEVIGFGGNAEDWVDISAMGRLDNQLSPLPMAKWARAETDQMRLTYERLNIPPGTSVPQFAGGQIRSGDFVDAVVQGFARTYRLLRKYRAELLAPEGPLAAFDGKPIRQVHRDTMTYALILHASYHPRFQRDAIACEAMLRDNLRAAHADGQPQPNPLEDAEVADLFACDIPFFSSVVGSADVFGADGLRKAFPLKGDAWRESHSRIESLNDMDLDRQTSIIRVAMLDISKEAAAYRKDPDNYSTELSTRKLIATAALIGDRICKIAIREGERYTWLVPTMTNSKRLEMSVAGLDLYGGLSGIALFLGYLSSITGNEKYGHVARGTMLEALSLYHKDAASVSIGAFNGIGGLCYALAHLGAVTNWLDLVRDASLILIKAANRATRSANLDLHDGLAGFIVAALAVYSFDRNLSLIESLRPAIDRLYRLTNSRSHKRGQSVFSDGETGVSHGRAGAGLAFLRWAEATGEAKFRAAGELLLRRDIEINESARASETHNSISWCRGNLGIAMVALGASPPMINLFDADSVKNISQEITVSGRAALCQCHGRLGQLEFLDIAGRSGLLNGYAEVVREWRWRLLNEIVGGHWVADIKHTQECPSLMLGLSGTGYSLLRVAMNNRVPSVLNLEGRLTAIV